MVITVKTITEFPKNVTKKQKIDYKQKRAYDGALRNTGAEMFQNTD